MKQLLANLLSRVRAPIPDGFKTYPGDLLTLHELRLASRHEKYALCRDRCRYAYLGNGTSLCRVLGRYKMYVDTNDHGVSSHLLMDGCWEMWMVEMFLDLVKPGMIVADAGANLGFFALLMADLVGEHGHVHAFEPNPQMADRLRASVAVNGFGRRTTVHEVGLSDRWGEAAMAVAPNEPGGGHLIDDVRRAGAIPIQIRRLDSLNGLENIDFIKIDVEGSEERLWAGMSGIIAQNRPLTIILEFIADRYRDPSLFLNDMLKRDFTMQHLTFDDGVVPITPAELLKLPATEDQMILLTR